MEFSTERAIFIPKSLVLSSNELTIESVYIKNKKRATQSRVALRLKGFNDTGIMLPITAFYEAVDIHVPQYHLHIVSLHSYR